MPSTPVPTPAPKTTYLRRGPIIRWLETLGIDSKIFDKLVDAGTIKPVHLYHGARGYYLREAIEDHILKPFEAERARHRTTVS